MQLVQIIYKHVKTEKLQYNTGINTTSVTAFKRCFTSSGLTSKMKYIALVVFLGLHVFVDCQIGTN